MTRDVILGKLEAYKGINSKLSDYQTSGDIIREMIKAHKDYSKEYDKISGYFWKGSIEASCKNIFEYLKKNITYRIEKGSRQTIKSPSAFMAQKHGDCKHYSLFIAGILDSWKRSGKKINWCYRFANYKLLGSEPHHVFVVVDPGTNKEIWVDPVLDYFNEKKLYYNKIDKSVDMALYRISGIGCNCNSIGQQSCQPKKLAKFAPPLVAARKAYLALIRLNFRNTAVKLYIATKQPTTKQKILNKWCKLGGNGQILLKTIEKAWNRYKRRHPNKAAQIGVAPLAGAAALWATAAPIIAAMAPILAIAAKLAPSGSKSQEILETASEAAEQVQDNTGQEAATGAMNTKNWILAAAGIGAVYFLTKKRR